MRPKILITLDVEECDIPIEYGHILTLEEQLKISEQGVAVFMKIMDKYEIPVTLFCTGVYAQANASWIKYLHPRHEIASHGFYHSKFDPKVDLVSSKLLLEEISGKPVYGFRMARMQEVDSIEIANAGYVYQSSLNPTWIPGRYDHRDKPRKPFFENGLWQVPTSVATNFRIPLFWLAFKNFPLFFFRFLSRMSLKENGYLNLYFHPWEFSDLGRFSMPAHVKRGHKGGLAIKLEKLIQGFLDNKEVEFTTMQNFVSKL